KYFGKSPILPKDAAQKGYYSVKFPDEKAGHWLLIGLNSNIGIGENSEQLNWLEGRLRESDARCVLAFSHAFAFSSGLHGHSDSYEADAPVRGPDKTNMGDAFKKLYQFGASIMLTAHDHHFEQFGRQDHEGAATPEGVRPFVVGTGGK